MKKKKWKEESGTQRIITQDLIFSALLKEKKKQKKKKIKKHRKVEYVKLNSGSSKSRGVF